MNIYRLKILKIFLHTAVVLGAVSSWGLSGCSSSSERMNEAQVLTYKRSLIAEHSEALSPQHKQWIWFHPARTREELDRAVDEFRDQFARRQVEPGWALGYTWRGEERQSRFHNREGVDRVRVSELIPLPFATSAGGSEDGSESPDSD